MAIRVFSAILSLGGTLEDGAIPRLSTDGQGFLRGILSNLATLASMAKGKHFLHWPGSFPWLLFSLPVRGILPWVGSQACIQGYSSTLSFKTRQGEQGQDMAVLGVV